MAKQSKALLTAFVPAQGMFWLQIGVIAAAVLAIYAPVFHGDWLWDDNVDITDNAITQSPTGLWNIWFEPGSQLDYYPIKASVQWVQWHLWGMNTLGYHLTNILLHIIGSLLVWRLLGKFNLKFAWLGGLLFAIHPVNVESVAWIAELKNTLSLPPFLLAMIAWIDYDQNGKRRDYCLALVFFLIAMLCKTTMAMFPFVILLYAWWKRGRIGWRDMKASTPFFVVSLVLGLVTFVCENANWFMLAHQQIPPPIWDGSILSRMALAGLSLAFYFCKCLWPVGLLPVYPKWNVDSPSLADFLPWLVVAGVIWGCWVKRNIWGRHALLGFGFFAIMLALFLGFETANYMGFTWVMDHFLYIPIIGLIGLTMAGAEVADAKLPHSSRFFTIGLVGIILTLFGFGSYGHAKKFINEETLWTYTEQANPDAWLAYNNLGLALSQKGQLDEAVVHFQKALAIKPDSAVVLNNLGFVLFKKERLDEAMTRFQAALAINPAYANARNNLGSALFYKGQVDKAMTQYQEALQINPNSADFHNNLGRAFFQKKKMDEAITQYQKALEINPDFANAHYNLGNVLAQKGQLDEAIEQYRKALAIDPGLAKAHYALASALFQKGQMDEAMTQDQATLAIDPNFADAHYNLGIALAREGRRDEAMVQYRKALEIDPNSADTLNNLGIALSQKGQLDEAIEQYQKALKINPDSADTHNNLGIALGQKGRMAEALVQFQEAVRLNPHDANAQKNLAQAQAMLRQAHGSK